MAKPNTTKLKRWTKEEIEFLKENFATMMHKELGEALGRTEQAVRTKCFELKLYKKEYPWTQKELDFLNSNYNNMTYREIAHELGRTLDAVRSKAALLGIVKDSYYCDVDYFKEINTEEKAYWLGFIFADGWTYLSKSTEAGCLGIELQAGDVGHLKKFNKSIHGNYKIDFRTRSSEETLGRYFKKHHKFYNLKNSYETCFIRIYSRKFTDNLINNGVIPNKSLVKQFPNTIPDNLMPHFIRGYFDGNGCVSAGKNSANQINSIIFSFFSGSECFITDLRNHLIKHNIYCSEIHKEMNLDKTEYTSFSFTIYSNYNNSKKFYDYIYENCSIYLDRKYYKAKNIISKLSVKKCA